MPFIGIAAFGKKPYAEDRSNTDTGVAILGAGAIPVIIGGDHSVSIRCIKAFAENCARNGPIHVVQVGASGLC